MEYSSFTKPLLLTSGFSNLANLVVGRSLKSGKWELQIVSIHFTHDCTFVLYKQLIKTGSELLLLPLSSVLGFPLYKDTGNGRAAQD